MINKQQLISKLNTITANDMDIVEFLVGSRDDLLFEQQYGIPKVWGRIFNGLHTLPRGDSVIIECINAIPEGRDVSGVFKQLLDWILNQSGLMDVEQFKDQEFIQYFNDSLTSNQDETTVLVDLISRFHFIFITHFGNELKPSNEQLTTLKNKIVELFQLV